jgi:DNA-directed RNA polymerase subunit RPC12/RpoP
MKFYSDQVHQIRFRFKADKDSETTAQDSMTDMDTLRIYADFNGLVRGVDPHERTAVVLDTFGSLRDLANAGVVLKVGLPLIAVDWSDDDEDLEGHGTAQYDDAKKRWIIEFDEAGVRYVPAGNRSPVVEFLCVHCRHPLQDAWVGADSFRELIACPQCGTRIDRPFAPP